MKRFKLTVRRDLDDNPAWLVNVAGQPGAHTFGRSLTEAKRRAVGMVALWSGCTFTSSPIRWSWALHEGGEEAGRGVPGGRDRPRRSQAACDRRRVARAAIRRS
jgi:hypothetical protein